MKKLIINYNLKWEKLIKNFYSIQKFFILFSKLKSNQK